MINKRNTVFMLAVVLMLASCNYTGGNRVPDPTQPPVPTQPPKETSAPATDAVPLPEERSQEAIMVLEPGPGSRVTSPITVRGVADPTFEQTLVARLVDASGSVLIEEPLMIQSPLGERGPFEGQIEFTVSEATNVFLQVYATSARDGGITHLETVGGGITLLPAETQDIVERDPYPEQIAIFEPQAGQQISAGSVHVEGFGLASFEGTLVLELYDAEGTKLGSTPIIVASPDMGTSGHYSGDVPYSISEQTPARLVVRDPLPTGNGVNHITSVEIRLQP